MQPGLFQAPTVPPPDYSQATTDIVIHAASEMSNAVCRLQPGSPANMPCDYANDVPQPLPAADGLWIARCASYSLVFSTRR